MEKEEKIVKISNDVSLRDVINCIIDAKPKAPSRKYVERILAGINNYEPKTKLETIRFITGDEYGEENDNYNIYTLSRNKKTNAEYLDELLMNPNHKKVFSYIKEDLKKVVELSNIRNNINSSNMISYVTKEEGIISKIHILYDEFWGEGYISYAKLEPYIGFSLYIGDKVYCPKIYGENHYQIEDIENLLNNITVSIDECPKTLREKIKNYLESKNKIEEKNNEKRKSLRISNN